MDRILAGATYEVVVEFNAPIRLGSFIVVLQHRGKNGDGFGEKVACDFIVEDPNSESARLMQ